MVELILDNQRLRAVEGRYENGRLAIAFHESTGPYGKLTVNMPEVELLEDEFLVKTWSEGAELAAAARSSGQFMDTGRRVPAGYAVAEVWTLAPGVTLD